MLRSDAASGGSKYIGGLRARNEIYFVMKLSESNIKAQRRL